MSAYRNGSNEMGRAVARSDAEIALNAGDHRLAIYYLCQLAGPPFDDLWRYATDRVVSTDPPGALRLRNSRQFEDAQIGWPDEQAT